MKKLIALTLFAAICTQDIAAKNSHFFRNQKRLTIPQTQAEKREGERLTEHEASFSSTLWSFFVGGAVTALGMILAANHNNDRVQNELTLAGVVGGVATGFLTYNAVYPVAKESATNKYRDYAPLNDELQRVLRQASTYNHNLIDIAQRVVDIHVFVKEVAIESANRTFPTLDTYNDLDNMLSYVKSAEKTFEHILYDHGELSLSAEHALRDFIADAKATQRIIKEIMIQVKVTPFYASELEEKRRVSLYNAELNRVKAETYAHEQRASRERAERERAQAEREKASAEATQAWVDLICGKPQKEEIHVHI